MDWISVNDRLPDMNREVLIYVRDLSTPLGEIYLGCLGEDGEWHFPTYTVGRVTHWMPLPAAPCGEE